MEGTQKVSPTSSLQQEILLDFPSRLSMGFAGLSTTSNCVPETRSDLEPRNFPKPMEAFGGHSMLSALLEQLLDFGQEMEQNEDKGGPIKGVMTN